MLKLRLTFSFSAAMKIGALLFLLISSASVFAQEKNEVWIVFDKDSKDRIAEVNVINNRMGKSGYNNLKGEFKMDALVGDLLIFKKQNYFPDTIKVQNFTPLAIYLKRSAIQLREVTIRDSVLTPEQQLEATKRDYNKVYGPLADRDLLSTSPGFGAGISIDALYNTFSREGRNAAHLRQTIQDDYYQNVVDYRFNRVLVARITGLKDTQVTDFMQKYRPSYYFASEASDYDFITSIKANLKRYLRRPRAYTLPKLIAPTPGK